MLLEVVVVSPFSICYRVAWNRENRHYMGEWRGHHISILYVSKFRESLEKLLFRATDYGYLYRTTRWSNWSEKEPLSGLGLSRDEIKYVDECWSMTENLLRLSGFEIHDFVTLRSSLGYKTRTCSITRLWNTYHSSSSYIVTWSFCISFLKCISGSFFA